MTFEQPATCEYPELCRTVCGSTLAAPFKRLAHLGWNERNALAEAEAQATGPTCTKGTNQGVLW